MAKTAPAKSLRPLATAQRATQVARAAAKQLLKSPRWHSALSGATPVSPLLVQRLDREDRYYYIVQFARHGGLTARLLVDAVSGELEEAGGIENASEQLSPFVSAGSWLASMAGKPIELRAGVMLVVRPATITIGQVLGWKPCQESASAFRPFYLLYSGEDVIYLRVDGKHYTTLHQAGPA